MMTMTPLRLLGQAAVYAGFAILVWHFSQAPAYRPIPPNQAQIKLSFAHGGKAKGGCRDRTTKELAKLAPNMRAKLLCPRERVPVVVAFELNGQLIYEESLPPTGIRGDGASRTYRKFLVPEGRHVMAFKLRDTDRVTGFDYAATRTMELKAGQNMAVDFDAVGGGFKFR